MESSHLASSFKELKEKQGPYEDDNHYRHDKDKREAAASQEGDTRSWKTIDIVRDYGAVGDGVTDDTAAFAVALRDLQRNGGGTLYVPGLMSAAHSQPSSSTYLPHSSHSSSTFFTGTYLICPLNLTSHLHLSLGANATLLGMARDDKACWPLVPPLPSYGKGRGGGVLRHASLLQGNNVQNVTIKGDDRLTSRIDGQGNFWWPQIRNGTLQHNPGHLVEFMYATAVRLYNTRLENSPSWNVHLYDCDHVHVRNVDIWAPESSPYTDGWDPDSSRHVLIEDSTYSAGDDCVAIKAGWDCFGIAYGKPAVNITIRNVTCHGYSAGIALGSEMSGGIENVTVENVRFTKSNKPVDIKVGKTRGGYVRNVVFKDIVVDGPIQRAIHVDMFHYNDSPNPACPDGWKPPALTQISNLTFVRFDGRRATYYDYLHRPNETFHFMAYNQSPIRHVYMEDVHFPTNGLAWNCSAVHGVVRGHSVTPWPPCKGFVVVDQSTNTAAMRPLTEFLADGLLWCVSDFNWLVTCGVVLIVVVATFCTPLKIKNPHHQRSGPQLLTLTTGRKNPGRS